MKTDAICLRLRYLSDSLANQIFKKIIKEEKQTLTIWQVKSKARDMIFSNHYSKILNAQFKTIKFYFEDFIEYFFWQFYSKLEYLHKKKNLP
ncbi:MAG: hypothetical protein GF353_17380 [Candidatus Lokiarchaeota archaeon]|nr:hypothetical protein [Candidatus Lokiarchaeota archaeon]